MQAIYQKITLHLYKNRYHGLVNLLLQSYYSKLVHLISATLLND